MIWYFKKENMSTVVRSRLKGGRGDISFLNFADCTDFRNCRLLSEMTLSVGASIGEHTHENESEYYIMSEGTGLAVDNGVERIVEKGDLVVTNHGESHKLVNMGDNYLSNTYISEDITEDELKELNSYCGKGSVNYWSLTHNCAEVACNAWNLISDVTVSPYNSEFMFGTVATPNGLKINLRTLPNSAEDYSLENALKY